MLQALRQTARGVSWRLRSGTYRLNEAGRHNRDVGARATEVGQSSGEAVVEWRGPAGSGSEGSVRAWCVRSTRISRGEVSSAQ